MGDNNGIVGSESMTLVRHCHAYLDFQRRVY